MVSKAYEEVDLETYSPRFWREILTSYTYSMMALGRAEDALNAIAPVATNPKYLGRLAPVERSYFLVAYAGALDLADQGEKALEAMMQARQALPSEHYRGGAPMAYVLQQEAFMNFDHERYETAYLAMARSNDVFFNFQEEQLASNGEIARNRRAEIDRVVSQAVLGWALANQMKEAESR